ncbi:MAG TPA: hydantoinase/oxoprolinase family protein [Acidimicrobiales bacterium]|nr:hydantoinase/oxoprolinase family protein [Acidimicrobiales bacterium]
MSSIVAVDSGGTFTDCVIVADDGTVTTAKSPSTPSDFSEGVIDSVALAAQMSGMTLESLLAEVDLFAHGTTVATNALITRHGTPVGLVTTKGHEDAVIIGRTIQKAAGLTDAQLRNLAHLEKAVPLVPRPMIKGVTERIDYKGHVVVPLDLDEARRAVSELVGSGARAIAVCFLWSFMNTEHERAVAEMVRAEFPDLFVTTSHEVAPVIKEYERGATTVLSAYLSTATHTYISALQAKLSSKGLRRDPVLMQSAGGVTSAEEVKGFAVALLGSGPAGGVLGAAALGRLIGARNIVTTDVGGTSFDVGLVVDGEPLITGTPVFDKYHTVLPVIDVASIGAGGGSIAWVEPGTGHLKVGPQSAGADPGPVCYGSEGFEPTVTDADVVLGRIDPGYFLGGARKLDATKAEEAIRRRIAEPLGMSTVEAAMGIVEIIDARMADLVRMETIGRGYDPRDFAHFAFGGAGPLHVGAYGLEVGAAPIVIPAYSSVFSAFGIAGSDLVTVKQSSDPMLAPFDVDRLNEMYEHLESAVCSDLESKGVDRGKVHLIRQIEMRYRGQVHEIRVPLEGGKIDAPALDTLKAEFERRYNLRFGRGASYREAGIEARSYLVRGVGRLRKPERTAQSIGTSDPSQAQSGTRDVYFRDRGFVATAVFRRERLTPGNVIVGPSVIEALDTTVLVHPDQRARVDGWTNIAIEEA